MQRTFARVHLDYVESRVDLAGLQTTEEVIGGLVEDVSFRLRQIIYVSGCRLATMICTPP